MKNLMISLVSLCCLVVIMFFSLDVLDKAFRAMEERSRKTEEIITKEYTIVNISICSTIGGLKVFVLDFDVDGVPATRDFSSAESLEKYLDLLEKRGTVTWLSDLPTEEGELSY